MDMLIRRCNRRENEGSPVLAALTPQRLAQAAFLYYVEGLSQEQVSRQLGVSRSNVSRMLTSAREQKLVRFEIDYPTVRNHSLESAVQAQFGGTRLKTAVVVDVDADAVAVGSLLAVCRGASAWLSGALRNGQTIGLSWGRTIQTLVDSTHFDGRWDVNVVQLSGVASLDPARSGHDLVRDLAERIGGRYSYFNAPAVAPTKEVAASLAGSPLVASALRQARSVDLAILGLAAFNEESSRLFLHEVAEATPEELAEAEAKGVIGQICGRFFDVTGAQVDIALTERVLSIDLPDLRTIPSVAIVASGRTKARALASAVLGGLADVIIVDSALARDLLTFSAG
ncbi:MAG: hypothetical protein QOF52_2992 [Propionibacteriaceae bacterium]|jgi:deoxyribonucleoside regulator|nr:sugar-binding transcriptional regulator [Propionibacteriaceae bacterium]MDX6323134.1 hypothetical protein [Propionibacteriaceae bacterium]